MEELIKALIDAGSAPLASEEAACAAVVAVRFPNGITCPRCGASCTRAEAKVVCHREKRPHSFTILVGTPFGSKLEPSVRALLLAMHAMSSTNAGMSARALARVVGRDHTVIWRHIQTLRLLVPAPVAASTETAATLSIHLHQRPSGAHVQLTGRNSGAHRAWARVEGLRISGEATRNWLNGTFHGVSARWLPRYICERAARTHGPADWLRDTLPRVLAGQPLFYRLITPPTLTKPPKPSSSLPSLL